MSTPENPSATSTITPSALEVLATCVARADHKNSSLKFRDFQSASNSLTSAHNMILEHLNGRPAINPHFSKMNGPDGCVANILKMFHHRPDHYVPFISQALWYSQDPDSVDLETTAGLEELSNILNGLNDDGEYLLLTNLDGQRVLAKNTNEHNHRLTRPTEVCDILAPLVKEWECEAVHAALTAATKNATPQNPPLLKM